MIHINDFISPSHLDLQCFQIQQFVVYSALRINLDLFLVAVSFNGIVLLLNFSLFSYKDILFIKWKSNKVGWIDYCILIGESLTPGHAFTVNFQFTLTEKCSVLSYCTC